MGAGGRMTRAEEAQRTKSSDTKRAPTEKPPFTVGTLKKAIPPHCFNRSVLRSGSYLVSDLLIIAAAVYGSTYISNFEGIAAWSLWVAYWIVTGFPYFSWKYSHRRHHSNTASLERDEVFVPKPKDALTPWWSVMQTPPGRLVQIFSALVFGWPMYLAFNVSGRKYPRWANHYNPTAPIFNSRESLFIFISDVALVIVAYGLYTLGTTFGLLSLLKVYGVPLLIVNAFLVLITYLQHTHASLPHYTGEEWDWLRGALSTVDRDYGILNHVFHHITDTHVAHHIFSTMPHYHASEATKILKPILGKYYQFDDTPFYQAIWREMKECVYVEADSSSKGILWYNNKL
ncbi:hypothetical protein R1sor_010950 [Riccia sorocarpa]|uniref:Fatty acid desaturase domain-containing protein n=1 Tax=Riccia sorocarpa TaxID=122646 RepID=A0ABD3I5K3_9MARC